MHVLVPYPFDGDTSYNLEYLHHMTLYWSFTLEHSFGFIVFKIPSHKFMRK
jgi:hypothetical protein